MKMKLYLPAAISLAVSFMATAGEPTAFELVKAGDQYVGVQSKDKVIQIRSTKSFASLTPEIWFIVYYDPNASFKTVQVKFGAGQEMDVSYPGPFLGLRTDEHNPFDPSRLKVDSNRAIQIALSQPLLKNLKIKATQLWLEHGDTGPQWRVKLWAARLDDPYKSARIGIVILSATDGSILQDGLHPGSVD